MSDYCDHDDLRASCPVASCNPRGQLDPFGDGKRQWVTARTDGMCPCSEPIYVGDVIVQTNGVALHSGCVL